MTDTITKQVILESIEEKFSKKVNKTDAKNLLDDVIEHIISGLESGKQVKISGLGNFELKSKKQRVGRNPKTKEEKVISARKVAIFHASQMLKDKINKN